MGVNTIDHEVPGALKDLKEALCCFVTETQSRD